MLGCLRAASQRALVGDLQWLVGPSESDTQQRRNIRQRRRSIEERRRRAGVRQIVFYPKAQIFAPMTQWIGMDGGGGRRRGGGEEASESRRGGSGQGGLLT